MLFERATFLVISHVTEKEHTDVHRFEKISNIIKQFKLSVSKTNQELKGMMVRFLFFFFCWAMDQELVKTMVLGRSPLNGATLLRRIYMSDFHKPN